MFIKDKDLNTMIKMENLIGMNAKRIFGKKKNKTTKLDNYEITHEDFIDYINLIEKVIQNKKVLSNRSNNYNKSNREYHNIMSNLSDAKKKGNTERYQYWKNKLQEYKNKKGV